MKKEISRENISNRYIQDLYRFFKLYIRRTEFTDPFAGHINLLHVSVLNPLLSDSDSLRLIGEYYFRRGYYVEALELFERLSAAYHSDSEIYQKIGFLLPEERRLCQRFGGFPQSRNYFARQFLDD